MLGLVKYKHFFPFFVNYTASEIKWPVLVNNKWSLKLCRTHKVLECWISWCVLVKILFVIKTYTQASLPDSTHRWQLWNVVEAEADRNAVGPEKADLEWNKSKPFWIED